MSGTGSVLVTQDAACLGDKRAQTYTKPRMHIFGQRAHHRREPVHLSRCYSQALVRFRDVYRRRILYREPYRKWKLQCRGHRGVYGHTLNAFLFIGEISLDRKITRAWLPQRFWILSMNWTTFLSTSTKCWNSIEPLHLTLYLLLNLSLLFAAQLKFAAQAQL